MYEILIPERGFGLRDGEDHPVAGDLRVLALDRAVETGAASGGMGWLGGEREGEERYGGEKPLGRAHDKLLSSE
ncbi:MAG: hypothetical protein QM820_36765 [Minicystis sp.]